MQTEEVTKAPPIIPLGDRVVVTPLVATERKVGGVIVPDIAQEKPQQGIVVALGPEVGLRPTGRMLEGFASSFPAAPEQTNRLSVGDRVIYGKYAGSEITIDDESFLVLREADVLGILPGAAVTQTEDDDL